MQIISTINSNTQRLYYKKILVALFISLLYFSSNSQTLTTTAGSISSCPGTITIPIDVTNFNDVASISLTLEYPGALMNYIQYINPHPQLSSGTLLINGTPDKVIISWFSLSPISIGTGKLIELEFDYYMDNVELSWDTATAGNCQYSDSNLDNIPATFVDGKVTSLLFPPTLIDPHNNSINIPLNYIFKWSDSYCSPAYRIQISKDSVFSDIVVAATGIFDTMYTANNLEYNTTYFWRVNANLTLQTSDWSDTAKFITKEQNGILEYQNRNSDLKLSITPNPVSDKASIEFELPQQSKVNLVFYNISGSRVLNLSNEYIFDKGPHTLSQDMSKLNGGIYFCELKVMCSDKVFFQREKVVILSR